MSEDSSVDRLNRKLYARGDGPKIRERRALEPQEIREDMHHDWMRQEDVQATHDALAYDPEQELEALRQGIVPGVNDEAHLPSVLKDERYSAPAMAVRAKRRVMARVVRSIFLASLAFFLIAAGTATYFFILGNNQVTCNKIRIDVSGPMSIPSGKELSLGVGITNDNPVALEHAVLVVNYPEGARSADNANVPLPTSREEIGTIDAGERLRTTSRSILFGREQDVRDIELTLEYKIRDSDAEFVCSVTNSVLISTAPVALTVDGLEEVSSDQELVLTATIVSNSEEVVSDQRLVVNYPFGYQFLRSEPDPTDGNNVWDIGDVGQGAKSTVVIYGAVRSPTTEARSVSFTLGARDPDHVQEVATVLQKLEHPLLIARPFLALEAMVNGSLEPTVSVTSGGRVQGQLQWKNTLPNPLYDVEIELKLPAEYIERSSVDAYDAFFRSVDNTIIWTPQTNTGFREVAPNASGKLSYSFELAPLGGGTGAREPSFELGFTVRARRSADKNEVQEVLIGQARRTIKFETDLQFSPRVAYSYGPFVNTGPHPPRVDAQTTYTIQWSIGNTTSELKDTQVRAVLPLNVNWLNKTEPEGEMTYNTVTREVVWRAGSIPAGTGASAPQRSIAFQIALTPSITQLGRELPLVQRVVAEGVDGFTGDVIEREVDEQTIKLVGDPMFPGDKAGVLP